MSSILSSTAAAAHAAAVSLTTLSQIKPGDALPSVTVKDEDLKPITLHDIPGKIVIVGVPAAFSPTCSNQAPSYVENFQAFQAKGVSQIYVLCVNDAFVMKGWKNQISPGGTTPVNFIADDTGAFTSKLGLIFDATPLLGAPRAKRFVIIASAGKVEQVIVEPEPTKLTITDATTVLAGL
ncbi:Redoxin [Clavulina sp. PMI_390]|nr:Redoxin [Clavulina sp. PMI_390]